MYYFGWASSPVHSILEMPTTSISPTIQPISTAILDSTTSLNQRVHEKRQQIYKGPFEQIVSLQAINEYYRDRFYPLAVLPFESKTLDVIVEYIDSDWTKSFYACAPEIMDPHLPVQHSFNLDDQGSKVEATSSLLQSKPAPESGVYGKVSIVRFIRDREPNRWFAVKEPKNSWDYESVFRKYENNLRIASRIDNHLNFMKVAGIVVKEEEPGFIPYLILDYIEGDELGILIRTCQLSVNDLAALLTQFIEAMIFLFKKGVLPKDINLGNLMVTKDKKLKFIDFDVWLLASDPYYLAHELSNYARAFTKLLLNYQNRQDQDLVVLTLPFKVGGVPAHLIDKYNIKESFKSYLECLSSWYQSQPIQV